MSVSKKLERQSKARQNARQDGTTFVRFLENLVFLRLITDHYPRSFLDHEYSLFPSVLYRIRGVTYFFHPAADRYLAYILPMDPIPISPIVGCSSIGEEGLTLGLTIGIVVLYSGFGM